MRKDILFKVVFALFFLVIIFSWATNLNFKVFSSSPEVTLANFQRLIGLTAFYLIFVQIITGSFGSYFAKIFGPRFRKFHPTSGVVVLVLVILHPLIFRLIQSLNDNLKVIDIFLPNFTTSNSTLISIGQIAFYLLLLTAFVAIFRRNKLIARFWFRIHILNFLVFFLLFYHSYKIGTDTALFPLNFLWPAMAIIIFFIIIFKISTYLKNKFGGKK